MSNLKGKTIAFDVQGTLVGRNQSKVFSLLQWCRSQDMKIIVWSNGISPEQIIKNHYPNWDLSQVEFSKKYSRLEAENWDMQIFDYAVEDDLSQNYLAAHEFIFVSDFIRFESSFDRLFL